jgi:hypothetical protein
MRAFLDKANLGLAVVALLAVVVKFAISSSAAIAAHDVAERQHRIVAAQTLSQVDNQLVQMMAAASAQTNDTDIKRLLADNGVQFTIAPSRPAAPAIASGARK